MCHIGHSSTKDRSWLSILNYEWRGKGGQERKESLFGEINKGHLGNVFSQVRKAMFTVCYL